MSEIIFVDGMRIEEPNENAPSWIKYKISFQADKLIPFIQANKNEKGWLNIDIKESKEGKVYCSLNTWKKGDTTETPKEKTVVAPVADLEYPKEDLRPEDIPF